MSSELRRVERAEDGLLILSHPQGLRAIAHPARSHAIERLFEGDSLTATELAGELGISASAMSYHLRELAKWGIVERDDSPSDGRERPWRASGTGLSVQPSSLTPGHKVLAQAWIGRNLDKLNARVASLADELVEDAASGERIPSMASYSSLWLTDEEREALTAALDAVFRDPPVEARTPRNHPEGAKRYEAWTFLLRNRDAD